MAQCEACGGRLRRIHRKFWERCLYYALYECRECGGTYPAPRRITFYFGNQTRCPNCGTERVKRLSRPDRIDRMYYGPLNVVARMCGGRLYHCGFCRLQFYDFRRSNYARSLELTSKARQDA